MEIGGETHCLKKKTHWTLRDQTNRTAEAMFRTLFLSRRLVHDGFAALNQCSDQKQSAKQRKEGCTRHWNLTLEIYVSYLSFVCVMPTKIVTCTIWLENPVVGYAYILFNSSLLGNLSRLWLDWKNNYLKLVFSSYFGIMCFICSYNASSHFIYDMMAYCRSLHAPLVL